ncbi:MAG: hypothetical protein Q8N76_00770 [Candidatus Omnitrophota bacterium]|nr:hypothetical protein [Candidatus Omnitrophota bacterium]
MTSSLSKSPSKFLVALFVISLIIASFNLPIIFIGQFLKIKESIEKESGRILNKNVTIGEIGFLPYGKLTLSSIKIKDKKNHASYLEIKRLDARFNILRLLMNKSALKKNKDIKLKGTAIFKKPVFLGQVNYKLDAIITPSVISIGDMTLDSDKFDIDIKGNVNDYLKNPVADLNITSKEINMPGIGNVNNLSSSLKITKDELIISNLDFFLNNFPIGARCRISDFKSPRIEFNLMSYPGQTISRRMLNPLNFSLNFLGAGHKNSIKGEMIAEIQKAESINPGKTFYVRMAVSDLSCVFLNKVLSVSAKNISCETDALDRKISLKISDFWALLYAGKKRIYLSRLNLSIYEGLMKGSGYLDFQEAFPKLLLDFKIYKLNIAELAKAQNLNYDLKGALDFKGVFNNRRDPCLSGRLNISDGYLKNIKLLGMVSDFLSVPSLKSTYFKDLSSMVEFSWINKDVLFDKFIVTGNEILLKGSIKLKTTKKIKGNISARLSTEVLKEAFKLRLLFFLIGERLPYQDFEFEIGGFVNSPQIKWLSTSFRESITKYLSEGGKSSLEKSLEHAIEQLTR